jgi:hypothetical protein
VVRGTGDVRLRAEEDPILQAAAAAASRAGKVFLGAAHFLNDMYIYSTNFVETTFTGISKQFPFQVSSRMLDCLLDHLFGNLLE